MEGRPLRSMGPEACPAASPDCAHAHDVKVKAILRLKMNTRSRAACDLHAHACAPSSGNACPADGSVGTWVQPYGQTA